MQLGCRIGTHNTEPHDANPHVTRRRLIGIVVPNALVLLPVVHPLLAVMEEDVQLRNEACPCGTGKRFKHCHGRLPAEEPNPADDKVAFIIAGAQRGGGVAHEDQPQRSPGARHSSGARRRAASTAARRRSSQRQRSPSACAPGDAPLEFATGAADPRG